MSGLRTLGLGATACVEADVANASYDDLRPNPPAGDGYFYLIRIKNGCGSATLGAGRLAADAATCP